MAEACTIGVYVVYVVQVATLAVVLWYTLETHKLRKATDRNVNLLMKEKEPLVLPYVETGRDHLNLFFVFDNVGSTPALNVRATVSPTFDIGHETVNRYFRQHSIFSDGLGLLPGRERIRINIGRTSLEEIRDKYLDGSIPHRYIVSVKYEDLSGNPFTKDISVGLDHCFNRILPEDPAYGDREIGKIADELKGIRGLLKQTRE